MTASLLAVDAPPLVQMAPTGASGVMAVLVGVLVACGTYLLLQRALTRVLIGLALLTHAGNLLLLLAGGRAGAPPLVRQDGSLPAGVADPLPQALALTAIVIAFAVSSLLLALAYRSYVVNRDDDVPDDPEDRRIGAQAEGPHVPDRDHAEWHAHGGASRSADRGDDPERDPR